MVPATVIPVAVYAGAESADEGVAEIFRDHADSLVGMLWVFVGDRAVAEDLAQEAFVRLYQAWPRLRERDRAVAYLRTSAFNLARSGFRRRQVAARHRMDGGVDAPSAEDGALLKDGQAQVLAALRTLPGRQRECLTLRFYAELSENEIADVLHISPNSVKTHSRRGLQSLQRRLEQQR